MHWNAAGWIEIPINTYSLQNVNRLNFYFLVENVNQRISIAMQTGYDNPIVYNDDLSLDSSNLDIPK